MIDGYETYYVSVDQIPPGPTAWPEGAIEKIARLYNETPNYGPVIIEARRIGEVYEAKPEFSGIVAALRHLNWQDQVELWVTA